MRHFLPWPVLISLLGCAAYSIDAVAGVAELQPIHGRIVCGPTAANKDQNWSANFGGFYGDRSLIFVHEYSNISKKVHHMIYFDGYLKSGKVFLQGRSRKLLTGKPSQRPYKFSRDYGRRSFTSGSFPLSLSGAKGSQSDGCTFTITKDTTSRDALTEIASLKNRLSRLNNTFREEKKLSQERANQIVSLGGQAVNLRKSLREAEQKAGNAGSLQSEIIRLRKIIREYDGLKRARTDQILAMNKNISRLEFSVHQAKENADKAAANLKSQALRSYNLLKEKLTLEREYKEKLAGSISKEAYDKLRENYEVLKAEHKTLANEADTEIGESLREKIEALEQSVQVEQQKTQRLSQENEKTSESYLSLLKDYQNFVDWYTDRLANYETQVQSLEKQIQN